MTRTEIARRRHRLNRQIRETVAQRRFELTLYPRRTAPTADAGTPAPSAAT